MTPLKIEILLHYRVSGTDFRDGNFSAPAVREAINWFISESLLKTAVRSDGRRYALTERGEVYVTALCDMPLPIQTWAMPSTKGA